MYININIKGILQGISEDVRHDFFFNNDDLFELLLFIATIYIWSDKEAVRFGD